jgi:hypothetical protein
LRLRRVGGEAGANSSRPRGQVIAIHPGISDNTIIAASGPERPGGSCRLNPLTF